jgi:hypothetical protein
MNRPYRKVVAALCLLASCTNGAVSPEESDGSDSDTSGDSSGEAGESSQESSSGASDESEESDASESASGDDSHSDEGSSSTFDSNSGTSSSSETESSTSSTDSTSTAHDHGLPDSYHYEEYVFPEPNDDVACSGAVNSSAKIERVYFAQTHVMEPSWPLFFLIGDRPAMIKVDVVGKGNAPEVKVSAWDESAFLGELCLRGPEMLPTLVSGAQQDRDSSFTATLPRAWLRPGLRVEVRADTAVHSFSAQEIPVGPAPELNLAMVRLDVLNYNEGTADLPVPASFLPNFAGAVAASKIRLGTFPARLELPRLVVGGPAPEPIVLNKRLCEGGEDPSAGKCEKHDEIGGMDVAAASLRFVQALMRATGDYSFAFYYGNTGQLNPGGWGGDKCFVGADFGDIFIHEMGHALSLPHWGEGAYQPDDPVTDDYRYPYGGEKLDGGGRGDIWNYAQDSAQFSSPLCEDPELDFFGKERSDAMFRSMHCYEFRDGIKGPWDGYSAFSSLAIFRWISGVVDDFKGKVAQLGHDDSYFSLPRQTGFPTLRLDQNGERELHRDNANLEKQHWEKLPFFVPQQWDVPVHTVYGTYHPGHTEANILYEPLSYVGSLPANVDPTDPATFDQLKAGGSGPYEDFFWWPKDLTIKIQYESGNTLHAIYPFESVDRDWQDGSGPWRFDLVYWALTVPGDEPIKRIELYHRPFMVRGAGNNDEGNINDTAQNIRAATFMNDANLVVARDL